MTDAGSYKPIRDSFSLKVSDHLKILRSKSSFMIIAVAAFSLIMNVMLFTSPIYMLQVYDRVLSTRSAETLLFISLLAATFLSLYGFLDWGRTRLLVRAGAVFDDLAAAEVARRCIRISGARDAYGSQALRDLDVVRDFFSGPALIALCDAPWTPLFIIMSFALHPWIGFLALFSAAVIVVLMTVNERVFSARHSAASVDGARAMNFLVSGIRNGEALSAMGMVDRVASRWLVMHRDSVDSQMGAVDASSPISALIRFLRIFFQSAVLGLGAMLVIRQEMTGGAMIAASILVGRALAPIEAVVGQWRSITNARSAYARLSSVFGNSQRYEERTSLPAPTGVLSLSNVYSGPPGTSVSASVLKGASFEVRPGEIVGVIGPSGSGKSSLVRAVLGVWPIHAGSVRIDGAELSQWDPERLGSYIGYVPQDTDLPEGTIADNISRFSDFKDSDRIVVAAKQAQVHELIVRLPNGYDTKIGGAGGIIISGGQRQRIALARALYGGPSVLVFDEPNSNLDFEGEAALVRVLTEMKADRRTVILTTHRRNLLGVVDKLAVMKDGRVDVFGPRDEVLRRLGLLNSPASRAVPAPLLGAAQ